MTAISQIFGGPFGDILKQNRVGKEVIGNVLCQPRNHHVEFQRSLEEGENLDQALE
jgi:hypothetical protein